uniref:Uncharacterized protein n=1 Tax=Bactrocera latifrons TaxID=174628 RepID=A0A0K8TVK5_BACLA
MARNSVWYLQIKLCGNGSKSLTNDLNMNNHYDKPDFLNLKKKKILSIKYKDFIILCEIYKLLKTTTTNESSTKILLQCSLVPRPVSEFVATKVACVHYSLPVITN